MAKDDNSTARIAERRRADAERQRRSRASRKATGTPRQDQIDAALVEALAHTLRCTMARDIGLMDFKEDLRVDVGVVLSRAIQILSREDPRRDDRTSDPALRRVVATKAIERLTIHRPWWSGSWRVPKSVSGRHSPPASDDASGAIDGTSSRQASGPRTIDVAGCADLQMTNPIDDTQSNDANYWDDWVFDAADFDDRGEDDLPSDAQDLSMDAHE
jgi:hypothetical protein